MYSKDKNGLRKLLFEPPESQSIYHIVMHALKPCTRIYLDLPIPGKYTDKSGVRRFVGDKDALKKSQLLDTISYFVLLFNVISP